MRYLTGAGFGVTRAGEGVVSQQRRVVETAGHLQDASMFSGVALAFSLSVAMHHALISVLMIRQSSKEQC